jgi:Domain of unknown function (DUF4872)/Butirosin biosynthesis protein H, N-terminal
MTGQKHLKQRIRARMEKTGERYAAARRQIIRQIDDASSAPPSASPISPLTRGHTPGNIPATAALRSLLSHAGVQAPHTQQPFSEAMLFGVAGGIGIGVFAFYYEKADVATFFLSGRHQWHDDQRYLTDALERMGVEPAVQEAGGAKLAAEQLQGALAERGPCVVWVDQGGLPHRAIPERLRGSGYHVITVYQVDLQAGSALIGDLTDEPITIPLEVLAEARGRIRKDRRRILSVVGAGALPPLAELVRAGLHACQDGLMNPTVPSPANARLDALRTWADRMEGARGRERWEQMYRPGPNLLRGLSCIHDFIEHYGTGGGLCRPIFADFLREAADALRRSALADLAERYAELGRGWSALADAALPEDVGMLRETRWLLTEKAELHHSGGTTDQIHAVWERLEVIEREAADEFPLSDIAYRELRTQLRGQIAALYEGEVAAQTAIQQALAAW